MEVEQELVSKDLAWREVWSAKRGLLSLRVLWLPVSFEPDWRSHRAERLMVELSAPTGSLLVCPRHFGSLRALVDLLEAEVLCSECLRGGDWR